MVYDYTRGDAVKRQEFTYQLNYWLLLCKQINLIVFEKQLYGLLQISYDLIFVIYFSV